VTSASKSVILAVLRGTLEDARRDEYKAKAHAEERGTYRYLDQIADEKAAWSRRVETALAEATEAFR
jgi:hypothetical protein